MLLLSNVSIDVTSASVSGNADFVNNAYVDVTSVDVATTAAAASVTSSVFSCLNVITS